jgi:tetratricopeptide (TPR) repeat protein
MQTLATQGAAVSRTVADAFACLPGSRRFSKAQCEVVHRLAYAALAAGEFQRAHRCYEWLVLYRGNDSRSWRGLAASAHALEDYGQALLHWTLVSLLEPDAVDATLYAGRCQAQLGQVREALETFDLVRRHPGADPALRQQAEQMLALLQQRRAA